MMIKAGKWIAKHKKLILLLGMLPKGLREAFFKGDVTMMIALFDNTTSSDEAMGAVSRMREIASEKCFISGMRGVITDIKNISLKEMSVYVVIAAVHPLDFCLKERKSRCGLRVQ